LATEPSRASSSKPKTRKTGAKKKATTTTASPLPTEQARSVAQSAVDLPVGAVLEVSDRVAELVEPFTARAGAEKQLKAYSTRLRRTVKRTERRGATARRRASAEASKTRNRVEREARKRQQRVRKAVSDQLSALR
jgi:hypothetical protein